MPFDEEDATVERTKRKPALRERAPRRLLLLLLLLLLIGSRMMQALLSETVLLSKSGGGAGDGGASGGGGSGGGSGGGAGARRQAGDHSGGMTDGVFAALELLRRSRRKYVIVDAKHGLGNRLRALASAMSVAAALQRPVMLVWVSGHAPCCAHAAHLQTVTHMPWRATCTATAPSATSSAHPHLHPNPNPNQVSDLHCNCSFHNLFGSPLPFAVLEEELPIGTIGTIGNMTAEHFQVYNYMRPDAWPALRDAPVEPDPLRHLYFRSASVMRHPMGSWRAAQRQMNRLAPVAEVAMRLVANKGMVGLHVRNVFDAPRDVATAKTALGKEAVRKAQREYGT